MMKNKTNLRDSTVACAFLLATSPAWANNSKVEGMEFPELENTDDSSNQTDSQEEASTPKNPFSGKTEFNAPPQEGASTPQEEFSGPPQDVLIESINLDQAYKKNKKRGVKKCLPPKVKLTPPRRHPLLSLAFDPNKTEKVRLQFLLSDVPTTKEKRVLVLLYSRCLSAKAKIKTPKSNNKLVLDTKDIEIIATYEVPASQPPTTLPATFDIDLETNKLKLQVKAGNSNFYFQAALLNQSDLDKGNYNGMILSPLEAIHASATKKLCPTDKQFTSGVNAENTSCALLPDKN